MSGQTDFGYAVCRMTETQFLAQFRLEAESTLSRHLVILVSNAPNVLPSAYCNASDAVAWIAKANTGDWMLHPRPTTIVDKLLRKVLAVAFDGGVSTNVPIQLVVDMATRHAGVVAMRWVIHQLDAESGDTTGPVTSLLVARWATTSSLENAPVATTQTTTSPMVLPVRPAVAPVPPKRSAQPSEPEPTEQAPMIR